MSTLVTQTTLAAAAGFDTAAKNAELIADRARRLAMAYEHYRYVTQGQIDKFNKRLYDQTIKRDGRAGRDLYENFDVLSFTPVNRYPDMPPADVLESVKAAQDKKIFDTMEVCKVQSVRDYKDPIVFGRIHGCDDRFYISQWDTDVNIADLIGPNEG